MSFFVFGISHKKCPVEVREKLHFTRTQTIKALELLTQGGAVSEVVILSTCNRVEFYGYTDLEAGPEAAILETIETIHGIHHSQFKDYLYRFQKKEAIEHLFRVAGGLDSLVVGENEILGQVKDAFKLSVENRAVHSLLYRLMEKALKLGKDVRNKTKISRGAVSIPSVAVELAEKIFGKLTGQKVLVMGTGEMGIAALQNLQHSGAQITGVISRSADRGREVAGRYETEWIPFDHWETRLTSTDILISCTSSQHPVIEAAKIRRIMDRRKHKPLFMIDIAVPRDIDAAVHEIDDVYLYNIDDLQGVSASNLNLRRNEIRHCEEIIEQSVTAFCAWLEQLKARPTLESFESFLDGILQKELAGLEADGRISPDQTKEISKRIRSKLLYDPIATIKETSLNGGSARYLEALRSLFRLDQESEEQVRTRD